MSHKQRNECQEAFCWASEGSESAQHVNRPATQAATEGNAATARLVSRVSKGPWLIRAGAGDTASSYVLQAGEELLIGSGPEAALRVADPAVSRQHCRVSATSDGLRVCDLDSTNGVKVGGATVRSALLTSPGPAFTIGRTPVFVHPATARVSEGALQELVGSSQAMQKLASEIRAFAPHSVSVLIRGETGTGKDLVARALHRLSGRRGPFVVLNIGAMSESLADAELFGHRKGAFTGAVCDRKGAFEMANGGTLFLDEVADLSPAVQVKLLRALEAKRIRPLGSSHEIDVDVRIISASWASLEERATQGRFRLDLYHRLSTTFLQVVPLRQRRGDIVELANHLLKLGEPEFGVRVLTDDAIQRLTRHHWPGNVRELKAVLSRAALCSGAGVISAEHVQAALPVDLRKTTREAISPEQALALVAEHSGNMSAAARAAGLPRTTFRALVDRVKAA